jgi:nicotinate phosphoribosyltransferase
LRSGESHLYTAKYSQDKTTLPGAKQIFRYADRDVIALYNECNSDHSGGEPLLRPVLLGGGLVEPYPGLGEIRDHAAQAVAQLPPKLLSLEGAQPFQVDASERLLQLAEHIRVSRQLVTS